MGIKQICVICERIFSSEDGFGICPECRNSNKPEEEDDDSMSDIVLADGCIKERENDKRDN